MEVDHGRLLAAAQAMIGAAAAEDGGGGKRKRGRPPRGAAATAKRVEKKTVVVEEEGEDVCFLCFDGGSLVLCDRRGCPKAYHPACVKRDEAFFQSKAKWNCGWHLCSICQKAAHHMCYTCTYSLCKACTIDVDYLSVRGNKGFCAACMKTVMLIENIAPGNEEKVQVDFDDKSSWEYLFKMYWIYLKGKLSLTLDELIQAKKPCKEVVPIARKEQHLDVFNSNSDCKSSISVIPSQHLAVSDSKKRRKKKQLILPTTVDCRSADKSSYKSSTLSGSTEWATKELLEFVGHMRNGDVSMLFNFDVQGLLLEYIKRNNLRDPHKKSQIICDARLMSLFLKPRVGHFEMLKLLEYHFLIKEDNQKEDILGNTVRTPNQVEGGGNNESLLKTDKNKKRKNHKKGEERGQQTNLDEFAAIDVHNIKLIYLRRSLMENLVTASGNFLDKVLGSIVRIRISTGDLKKDMYRLVQVVGTFKASVSYKVGGKTVDVMLKILNLNKKELVAIDAISNQDFSEDECRRFRQSIKCGFLKRMTVGQVQEKARALQEVRLNDWLDTEISRLNHLRDRASENGRKKELRECVEKIELLKTPEERQRRLHKTPQVHADRKMDPKCESDDDAGDISKQKQADPVKHIRSGIRKLGRDPISTQNKIKQAKINFDKGPSSRLGDKVTELHKRKEAGVLKAPTNVLSNGSPPSAYNSETEKLWHYRDPNGKIQGPFCLVQLRKWSTSGYFPPDMMVWSINTDEVESLHLADVLSGNFHKALPSRSSTSLPYQDRFYVCEDRHSSTVNPTIVNDGKLSNGSWNCSSATSVHQMTVHEDRKWTSGPTNGNISLHGNTLLPNTGPENQPDGRRFSEQSFVESWRPSAVNTASNNSDSNFALGSITKSSDSPDLKINALNLPSPIPVTTDTRDLENHANKDREPSQPCTLVQDLGMEELPSPTPKPSDRDEKASLGIRNILNPVSMMVDMGEKVDSSIGNSPSSLPNANDRVEKVRDTESKPPVTNLTSSFSKPTPNGGNEKAGLFKQNPHSPSPKTVDEDEKVNLSIQNVPSRSPNPNDGNDQILTSESNPPVSSLAPDFSTPKPSDREEKAGMGIQNPSRVDDNVKTDLSIQNMPNSSLDPSRHSNMLVQTNESKPPGINLTFTSSTAKLEDRDEKAGTSISSLSSPPPKMVNEDGKVDSTTQNLPIPQEEKEGNDNVQANESKPPSTNLTFISSTSKLKDLDENAITSIPNLSSPTPKMVDEDEKVDSTTQKLPISRGEKEGNDNVQANESKAPSTNLTFVSNTSKLKDVNEKRTSILNLSSPSPKMVNEDEKVDTSIQNLPSFPRHEGDENEKVQANESNPLGTVLTCSSSSPMPTDGDEKAGMSIQIIPSPSSETVNEDGEIDSSVQNFPSSTDGNEKVVPNKDKTPGISSFCPPDPSCSDEKAVTGIQNFPSISPKTVDGNGVADSTDQKLPSSQLNPEDGNEKVQSNESKPPGTSVICVSSTAEASDRDEKVKVGIQNLPSPSLKMVDGDEKVDSTSCAPITSNKKEKFEVSSDVCSDEAFFTPASNCDQFAPPFTLNHLCSPSNQRALSYELIEFTTLGDESVSDLLAEVDAMEAQGDVASPIPVMYSDDDFFEDSKGDYFASIGGMGHLFDFGKNDDASEQRCPIEYDIFDPGKRSDGEASTSNELRVDTRFNHNSGSQAENDLNIQINPNNMEHNINSGVGSLTQGMAYMGWGSNPGLAQVNTDMNENTSFGFMGHERQR